ncbi:MAG TPA: cupin domain-containing protein [Candidatus Dormibacteraeota bacterium]|nr:cupin domain-containing protein [Candidatus Dormibacteraeota bacterium]
MRPIAILTLAAVGVALGAAQARSPLEVATPQFTHALPNVPGKSLSAVVVDYAPGGSSRAHHHAPSGFVYAYVLSGRIRSQVDDQPAKVYAAGESFFEEPGAHHVISENASATEPAKLLAVFVANTGETLTIPDPE